MYAAGVDVCPHDGSELSPATSGPAAGPGVVTSFSPAFINAPTVNEIRVGEHQNSSTLIDPEATGNLEASDASQMLGREVDGYRLMQVLHEGRTSWLFEAHTPGSDERVAFKYIRPQLGGLKEGVIRYFHEAGVVSRLGHKNLVEVIARSPSHPERTFMVMELLKGEDLQQLLNRVGRLTSRRAVAIALQVIDGLRATRAGGEPLSHHDLRPQHIFLAARESRDELVKVLDFGVHHLQEAARREGLVQYLPPAIYRAPELNVGSGKINDPRCDIYSLGVILHQAISGQIPFLSGVGEPVLRLEGALDATLGKVLHTCMAQRPEERYPTLEALEDALRSVFNPINTIPTAAAAAGPALVPGPTQVEPGGKSDQQAPPARRPRRVLRLVVVIFTTVMTLGLALLGVRLLDHLRHGDREGAAPTAARPPSAPDGGTSRTAPPRPPDRQPVAQPLQEPDASPRPDARVPDAAQPDMPRPDQSLPDVSQRPAARPKPERSMPRPLKQGKGQKAKPPVKPKDPEGSTRQTKQDPKKISPNLVKDPFGD